MSNGLTLQESTQKNPGWAETLFALCRGSCSTSEHCIAAARQGISKQNLKLSDFVARQIRAGQIITLDVHLDAVLFS
jgi:hypothetical protein